ncbi:hypothetical protein ILUMI_16668 [Ignelater luminosus]|uniref:Endonuclease-reverse transcriptase n=1 Tax=Ignelater luminosus TaxID=2038154 RepID=A0A8K0CLH2_IGNLU|nr:hypothetical protein ILUMI_16668 [Ignelater luminosus]
MEKTEYMYVRGPRNNLNIGEETIKTCTEYKYLGTIISNTGEIDIDIEEKIIKERRATKALHGTMYNRHLTKETKRKIFHTVIESITTYGGEMWPLTNKRRDKIRAVELDYMRRNGGQSSIASRLENRALRWYGQGHVSQMGKERWPKRILEWSPKVRRRRGRPAVEWKTYITKTMEGKGLEEGDWEDRKYWDLRTANL